MNLIIKGMEMPERGIHHGAIVISETGNHLVVNKQPYNKCFALSEIPTPHGDLIDVDVLMDLLEKSVPEKNRGHQFYVFRHMLRNAPTIIEAEE